MLHDDIYPIQNFKTWILLGAIYSPWAILRRLQKLSGLFPYMERFF